MKQKLKFKDRKQHYINRVQFFKDVINLVSHWLLPEYCVCCAKNGKLLCQHCYQLIHFNPTPSSNKLFAQQYLDQTLILATYQSPISDLIKKLKYQGIKKVSLVLAELLYQHLKLDQYDVITWAPTSKKRVNERGFNQAELIACQLATKLNIPALPLLLKIRHTSKQAHSTFQERLENLQDSFAVNPEFLATVQQQKILIIDDVISTGSTLNECAKILKLAQAKTVTALAVARS